ncbi:coiled-coil domain-containing protein 36-like [Sinocyclocheilus grahami]|uniref:coiled-coil domain-containing protein 36-like n=1 Tax=Sinocyclocheilus grahami TaxID=75366 RepID=UPI0007ACCFC3|nr:PREDICTED: coiled-coil domain-containing protein 36-like [Sinocyclocheilus grahami]
MKPNVWNIKEMLSIPATSGGIKNGKGPGTSDYSSLGDSQFLLGSDISQGFTQEMSGQSRGSQHTSQEIKEIMVSSSYSSKPFLFGGDGKISSFTGGKFVGMLDRFEDEKRKAKEKHEREILTHGILQLQESLENSRETLLNRIDGSNDITKVIVEKMDTFSKTIKGYLNSVNEGITCQFETLQSQTQKEMADREAKSSLAARELSLSMFNLQRDLEHLKAEQSKEQGMLGKILSQLSTLISIHKPMTGPGSDRMIDSEVQTSPGLLERFCVMSAEKHHESQMICNRPVIYSGKAVEQNQCPLTTQKSQNRNSHALPVERQQTAVTDEDSPDASQRLWCKQLVETRPSSPHVDVQSTASIEDHGGQYVDRHLEAENPLYVRDNRFVTDAMPPLKVPRRRQKPLNYRGEKKALVLPQRQLVRKNGAMKFSKDSQQNVDLQCEQKDRVPLDSLCDNWEMTNKSAAENHLKLQQQATVAPISRCVGEQPLNPFSLWSEDIDSSQMMVEYKMAEWENVVPESKMSVIEGEGGLWQLFDFTNDSD